MNILQNSFQTSKYLVLDTETTGLNTSECGLIQVGAIALDEKLNVIESYIQDINPGSDIQVSDEALKVNGFTLERIQKGVSYTEFCQSFLEFLNQHFGQNKAILVGQFLPFDYSFLWKVFNQNNLNLELAQYIGNDFIDTKSLVNTMNLQAELKNESKPFPITSLSKTGGLKDILGIDSNEFKAHDALGDCLATREVLVRLLKM
jgi:DNA polymerase III epsilon subunit-like protein